jgi:hypothetical protein
MDAFEELERMAFNATQKPVNDDATPEEIARWQKLFSYSYEQAAGLIHEHNHIRTPRIRQECLRAQTRDRRHTTTTHLHYQDTFQ